MKILTIILTLASGCAVAVPAAQSPTEANGQVLVRLEGSIVAVGSFTLYRGANGALYALSAGHLVETNSGASYIGIWHDHPLSMAPLFSDTNVDFSVFSVVEQTLAVSPLAAVEIATNKDASVTTAGSYNGRWCRVVINGIYTGVDNDGDALYDMPGVTHGFSGAGVFDDRGRIVGVVIGVHVLRTTEEPTGIVYVCPVSSITATLRKNSRIELLPRLVPANTR